MKQASGFTLVELLMFIVIVSFGLTGIVAVFVNTISHSHEPYLRQRALAVANAYMDEILQKRWDENTPIGGGVATANSCCGANTGENRKDYDDVDDYNGISNQQPTDATGTLMAGYGTEFRVSVSVTQPTSDWNGVPMAAVKQIVVDVNHTGTGETLSLTGYRLDY